MKLAPSSTPPNGGPSWRNCKTSFRTTPSYPQDFWRSVFTSATERVQGLFAQVALEHHYNKVWLA